MNTLSLLISWIFISTIAWIPVHAWKHITSRLSPWGTCSGPSPSRRSLLVRGGDIQYPENIIELDDILELTKSTGQLVVIDFFSDNCPPCERVAPLFEELSESEEFEGKVLFLKVNVQNHPLITNQYGVTGWPTFLFLKNGKVQTEIVGGKVAEATLYDWVKLLMPKEDGGSAGVELKEREEPEVEEEELNEQPQE